MVIESNESESSTPDASSTANEPTTKKSWWFSSLFASLAQDDLNNNSIPGTPQAVTPTPVPLQDQDENSSEGEVAVFHDLLAGGVAGSASVVVGHPFDTLKVRLQTSAAGSASLLSLATSFGGVSSLFRGMSAPLLTASAVNAVIFSAYGTSSRYWDEYVDGTVTADAVALEGGGINVARTDLAMEATTNMADNAEAHDSWQKAFACGSFAGVIQGLIICPTEHVKCRLQIQHGKGAADHMYKGPLQAGLHIVRQHGLSGLYRGWAVTAWREIPAFGLYFSVYDYAKDEITSRLAAQAGLDAAQDDVPHSHLWISSALSGGLSGSITWAVIYPFDVIKSRIQTAPLDTPLAERRIWAVGSKLVQTYGWRVLFRGLGITLVRAFPVNGIIFPVYEFTLMHLTGELGGSDDDDDL